MRDINLALIAGEAKCEPLLRLSPIAAAPSLARNYARNVVNEPFRNLAQLFDRADAGLFIEFTQGRFVGVFPGVDAALRHLPLVPVVRMLGSVDSPPDEGMASPVEHHHAHAGTIGERVVGGHLSVKNPLAKTFAIECASSTHVGILHVVARTLVARTPTSWRPAIYGCLAAVDLAVRGPVAAFGTCGERSINFSPAAAVLSSNSGTMIF